MTNVMLLIRRYVQVYQANRGHSLQSLTFILQSALPTFSHVPYKYYPLFRLLRVEILMRNVFYRSVTREI